MVDYISREAAIEKITALINKSGKYTDYESGADDACYIVEYEIPSADVRPVVRATWEPSEKYNGYVSCSNCHDCYLEPEWVERLKWRFCPNCGADMREVKADG